MTAPRRSWTRHVFADYLARTRWFGGKGRPFAVTGVRTARRGARRTDAGPRVVIHLVDLDLRATSEGGTETYQVPLAFYEHPESRLEHAFVGWWEDRARLGARVRRAARPRRDGLLAAVLRRRRRRGR